MQINYLSIVANPLETAAFKEGDTGSLPKNTSNRAEVTFIDSIVASTAEGKPPDETETWRKTIQQPLC